MKAINDNGNIKTFSTVPKSWGGNIGLQYASDSDLEALGFYDVEQPTKKESQEYGDIEWDAANSRFTYPVMSLGKKKMLHQAADSGVVNTENFNTVLWTGNGTDNRAITGVGFQPDLLWIKKRSSATNSGHMWFDVVRGVDVVIGSDRTNAEFDAGGGGYQHSFDSDGFTLSANAIVNQSGQTYVAWNWKAGGAAVSNTDGSITSSVSANTDAGFSIVKYTGNDTAGATIGHGLSSAPDLIIAKGIDSASAYNWMVYTSATGENKHAYLNLTNQFEDPAGGVVSIWNDTAPTSSVFSISDNDNINVNNADYIAYCFHSVDGYQKVGSYTGTGATGNSITGLGFEPRFIIVKPTTFVQTWTILDTIRGSGNLANSLAANDTYAEYTFNYGTADADGFTWNNTGSGTNKSGETYIYLAIA